MIHGKDRTGYESAMFALSGAELEAGVAEGWGLTLDEAVELALSAVHSD
jgi:hypothetical protein